MASAQVLPNSATSSRKQEHLEAGKRRLEEFRKKRAAERSKKSASSSHPHNSEAVSNKNEPSAIEHVQDNALDEVSTSDGVGGSVIDKSFTGVNPDKIPDLYAQNSNQIQVPLTVRTSPPRNDLNSLSSSPVETHRIIDGDKQSNASTRTGSVDVSQNNVSNQADVMYGIHPSGVLAPHGKKNNQTSLLRSQGSQEFDSNASLSTFYEINDNHPNKSNSLLNDYTVSDHGSFPYISSKISPQNSIDIQQQRQPSGFGTSDTGHLNGPLHGGVSDPQNCDLRKAITSSGSNLPSLHDVALQTFDSTGSEGRNSSNFSQTYMVSTESSSRRSRPSFLDSLNVNRPSGAPFQHLEPEKDSSMSNNSESSFADTSRSTHLYKSPVETKTVSPFSNSTIPGVYSTFELSTGSSVYNSNSDDLLRTSAKENSKEKKHDYYLPTQNEDFTALEQHIEDLTQENFSLQRALEASQALAESLAAENSSLTDSYNQQRSVVNQLKTEMEKLQEEIKAQLVELQSVRTEYTNAQLECNAADERANLLASEVIGLEDKALKLRSNELKLEKQLENAEAEISSYRRKMSSLEKDRQDLQSTIGALQEEKKLLQSKLRKAPVVGKSTENPTKKRDVSTSTEDIANADSSQQERLDSAAGHDADATSFSKVPEIGNLHLGVPPVNVPRDQMRMIENINALLSELALEKEELMKTLTSESSECSRLKDLNKELSQKLEIQTQRLELLTSQSMVNENIPAKQLDSHTTYENAPYADEGDEVVERVLGWIMKLFPGGPSRRRTSKLL